MTLTIDTTATTTPRDPVRKAAFLPAVGLVVAAAAQIDAAITTNAFRPVSPAPENSLNFPWYGELAGQLSTWWAFTGLFLAIGFAAFALSSAVRHSRAGRAGAWAAVGGAALIAVANFMSAANADAMMSETTAQVIIGFFAGATLLLGVGMTTAGVAAIRLGAWSGVSRFVPLANGIWPFFVIALIHTPAMQIAIGIMAASQVALGAALIAEEA